MSGGVWTALRMTELLDLRHADTRRYLASASTIVVVAKWIEELLLRNGVTPDRILLARQGVATPRPMPGRPREETLPSAPLRCVFLGRLHPMKGVHVILEALEREPSLPIRIDIYGTPDQRAYEQELRRAVACDARVRLLPPVPQENISDLLGTYDLTLVPSLVLETGPLVVYESHAAGVPVVGSALGGIAELVRDEVDGKLVTPTVNAWRELLIRVAHDRTLPREWSRQIRPPRTMRDVASEMKALYERTLSASGTARRAS